MKGLLINVLILGFLLTLYVYVNTDSGKTTIQENSAQTMELHEETPSNTISDEDISYRIEKGDTLSTIGNKFGVSVTDIKELNGLREDEIVAGDYIDIAVSVINDNYQVPNNNEDDLFDDLNDTKTIAQTYPEAAPDLGVPADNAQAQSNPEQKERIEKQQEREKRRQQMIKEREEFIKTKTTGESQPAIKRQQKTEDIQDKKEETKVLITEGEIVNLQSEMDIRDLIQTISEITGEIFILDESVKGKKVTVVAPGGFKKENAMRLFETILSLNGFSVVKKDRTNIIVPKRDIKFQDIPTEWGTDYAESSDRFITRLVELQNVKANDVANTLKPLISREGDIVVYPATNMLIIIERVDNLNRILKIIENFDVETEIEFIKIENADAGEVASKLLEIFGGTSSSSGTRRTTAAQRSATRTQQRGRTSSQSRRSQTAQTAPAITSQSTQESSPVSFKVITDERTNSLIIIAYPSDMAKIKAVIEILDVKTDEPQEGIYVIRILNADAEQIVGVLSALFGGSGGGGFVGAQRTSGFESGTGFGTGRTGGSTFGQGQTRRTISRQGTGRTASIVAETDNVRVTADPATNSVIIIGSRRDYEEIKDVIDELDIRRKQVFVEAAILEVSLEKLRAFGTNLSIGFTVNDSILGFGGTILPGVPSLLGVAANPDVAASLLGSLSGLFLGVVGEEVDVDGSGPIPPIPSFTALFQALTSLTDVTVLSTPSIITTDNEPAEIIVADVIPFPTGSTIGDGGVTVQTIEREPVGIRLSITPQISEGDFLNINILTEVSALRSTPVPGLNTAEFGIATTTRTADSSVVVKSGQTIVIGGLVQDRESVLQNRVPVLGSIPILGNLFKFKQRQSQKINLLILITPRIIENEIDMQRILEERQRRNMLLQERGFNREEPN
ncbi:MAG: type II secretion system secretin GspD [Candidatus Dadabacteria bacterium]|nr:type II secretion system secretin GspD [Candidatus Dadabacteria bacterium]